MSTPYTPGNYRKTIVTPGGVREGNLAPSNLSRVIPRQLSTGVSRGIQTISGTLIVADPITNNPVITISGVDQTQIFSDPKTQIDQILIGNLGDGTYGMKVAPSGMDVNTTSDSDLIFNSNQNIFKIAKVVEDSYTVTATDFGNQYFSFTIAHNLGFAPTIMGSFSNSAVAAPRPLPFSYLTSTTYFGAPPSAMLVISKIDDTYAYFNGAIMDAVGLSFFLTNAILSFKLYCLQETVVDA